MDTKTLVAVFRRSIIPVSFSTALQEKLVQEDKAVACLVKAMKKHTDHVLLAESACKALAGFDFTKARSFVEV